MHSARATPIVRAFTVEKVLRLTGLSRRQLQYWDERAFIRPSIASHRGRGRPRLYDFGDLVSLRLAAHLRTDWGISLQQIRKMVEHLRGLDYAQPLGDVQIFAVQRELYFSEAGLIRAARAPEQSLATFKIPFEPIVHSLEAAIAALEQRPVGEIEQRRGTLGSKPVVAGTRIPVATIERMASAGLREREMLERYPSLKAGDIRPILAAWRRSQSLGRRAS